MNIIKGKGQGLGLKPWGLGLGAGCGDQVVSRGVNFKTRDLSLRSKNLITRPSDLSQHKGFSLVELMIVVGIIGVLTAIAIPNFQRFQARSRQSEAKAGLSAIHTAAHAFHSEWEVYAGALQPLGWVPENTEFRYAIGFAAAQAPLCGAGGTAIAQGAMLGCGPAPGRVYRGNLENPGVTLTGGVAATSYGGMAGGTSLNGIVWIGDDDQAAAIGSADTARDNDNDGGFDNDATPTMINTDVDANFFTAGAVGNPRGYDNPMAAHFDYWSIDESKNLDVRLGTTLDEDL